MCKQLNIHRKAKESSAELLHSYFSPFKTKHKCCFTVSRFIFFSSAHYSPFTSAGAAMSQKWSALTCAPVRVGRRQGAGLCCHEWWWQCQARPVSSGWHQCSDSWFGTRSGRQRCKSVCVCFRVWCYLSWGRLVCRVGGMAVWVNRKLLVRQD